MVAHYTPARKLRHDDAYTPGNRHGARPNRATIIYTSRLKEAYRDVPVIIGGIEASLRRFAHYDFWEDRVRRSILLDAKADLLVYGMAERPLLEVVGRLKGGERIQDIQTVRGRAGWPERENGPISGFREMAGMWSKYLPMKRLRLTKPALPRPFAWRAASRTPVPPGRLSSAMANDY